MHYVIGYTQVLILRYFNKAWRDEELIRKKIQIKVKKRFK